MLYIHSQQILSINANIGIDTVLNLTPSLIISAYTPTQHIPEIIVNASASVILIYNFYYNMVKQADKNEILRVLDEKGD
jgi:hypothetical protein